MPGVPGGGRCAAGARQQRTGSVSGLLVFADQGCAKSGQVHVRRNLEVVRALVCLCRHAPPYRRFEPMARAQKNHRASCRAATPAGRRRTCRSASSRGGCRCRRPTRISGLDRTALRCARKAGVNSSGLRSDFSGRPSSPSFLRQLGHLVGRAPDDPDRLLPSATRRSSLLRRASSPPMSASTGRAPAARARSEGVKLSDERDGDGRRHRPAPAQLEAINQVRFAVCRSAGHSLFFFPRTRHQVRVNPAILADLSSSTARVRAG